MQPLYPNRINWQNLPSIDTPLGANNLNKMDYAIYGLDQRVLTLYGYQDSASTSASNAKVSETNAKISENNAKTSEANAKKSETNAKEYMEKSFATTPEGYEALVDTVSKMDIQTTTDTTLANSKEGGYKLVSMSGASVQDSTKGEQLFNIDSAVVGAEYYDSTGTLVSDESIKVVEMGIEPLANYTFSNMKESGTIYVAEIDENRNFIVGYSITLPQANGMTYYTIGTTSSGNTLQIAISTDVTQLKVSKGSTPGQWEKFTGGMAAPNQNYPQEIQYVGTYDEESGKYVLPIKSHGKNFLNLNNSSNYTSSGITYTPVYDIDGNLEYVNVNGKSTAVSTWNYSRWLKAGAYVLNGCPSGGGASTYQLDVNINAVYHIDEGNGIAFTLDTDSEIAFRFRIASGATVNNLKFYPMIRSAEVEDDAYEPYQEYAEYIYLTEPLRATDSIVKVDGVGKIKGKRVQKILDGTEGWVINSYTEGNSYFYLVLGSGGSVVDNVCLSTHFQKKVVLSTTTNVGVYVYNTSNGAEGRLCIRPENVSSMTLSDWLAYLAEQYAKGTPVIVEYELTKETYETLNISSQIALNRLKTFDTVTYLSVDSVIQPSEIMGEYGTSVVGARTLKNELRNDTLEIKYNELSVALVATGGEV